MATPSLPQTPTATQRDGLLTLSFPDAMTPTFWQVSPADFSVMGFAVQGSDKAHAIVLTTDADTTRVLAQYGNGGMAQDALAVILKAVQGRSVSCTPPTKGGGFFRRLLRWTLRLIFLGLLLWVGFMLWSIFGPAGNIPSEAPSIAQESVAPAPTPQTAPPPAPTGVPLSADDVLGE